jgi:hypothetical protein
MGIRMASSKLDSISVFFYIYFWGWKWGGKREMGEVFFDGVLPSINKRMAETLLFFSSLISVSLNQMIITIGRFS